MTKIILKVIGVIIVTIAILASVGFNLYTFYQQQTAALVQTGASIAVKQMVDVLDKGNAITLKDGDKEVTVIKKPEGAIPVTQDQLKAAKPVDSIPVKK